MEDTDVTAIVAIYNNLDQVLLLKRAESCEWEPGKWSLPGGHAVVGETEQQAAIREVSEETGIAIADLEFVRLRKKNYLFKTFTYSGIVTKETLDLNENTDFVWVGFEELKNYNIVPALKQDLMLIKR
jgi:8-oxo-dGTP pyrophosphatase MutT (NUDIX family)